MGTYEGLDQWPDEITIPDDGQKRSALSVNTPLEGTADRTRWLRNRLGYGWHHVPLHPLEREPAYDHWEFRLFGTAPNLGPLGQLQIEVAAPADLLIPVPGLPPIGRVSAFSVTMNGAGGPNDHTGKSLSNLTVPEIALARYNPTTGVFDITLDGFEGTYSTIADYDQIHEVYVDDFGAEDMSLGPTRQWFFKISGETGVDAVASALLVMAIRIQTEPV